MESDREAFEAAIQANWDDDCIRAIFADWLDERGEAEEAARMRNWTKIREESRKWVEEFAEEIGPYSYYDKYSPRLSIKELYDRLMEGAREYLENREYLHQGTNENYKEVNRSHMEEFWQHYYILTGQKPKDGEDGWFFNCSC